MHQASPPPTVRREINAPVIAHLQRRRRGASRRQGRRIKSVREVGTRVGAELWS